ncbi:hypothetical protein F2P81_006060 [Scophthalmus maximus]|uniref:Uncharacterized protein n=1 Tax=Scophthalmus maximus TaxID=52904 RepID=A0A6A4TDP8_SCOMX|nr:hypothetical protein F2P81_006060 [Scophthalmus maximus]
MLCMMHRRDLQSVCVIVSVDLHVVCDLSINIPPRKYDKCPNLMLCGPMCDTCTHTHGGSVLVYLVTVQRSSEEPTAASPPRRLDAASEGLRDQGSDARASAPEAERGI